MRGFRLSIIAASLGAAISLSIAVPSVALAGSWFVNGTKLANGATVAVARTAAADESTIGNAPSLGIRVTCSGGQVRENGAYIQGAAGLIAESVTLTGCSELSPTTCTVQTEITTVPVVGSFETGTGSLDRARFTPKTGKTFATLLFTGTCAEAGEQPIIGSFVLDSKTGQLEGASGALEGLGTTENNSLEIFKSKIYIPGGKALLKLASGASWSFH